MGLHPVRIAQAIERGANPDHCPADVLPDPCHGCSARFLGSGRIFRWRALLGCAVRVMYSALGNFPPPAPQKKFATVIAGLEGICLASAGFANSGEQDKARMILF